MLPGTEELSVLNQFSLVKIQQNSNPLLPSTYPISSPRALLKKIHSVSKNILARTPLDYKNEAT